MHHKRSKDGCAKMPGRLARHQLADAPQGGRYRNANPADDVNCSSEDLVVKNDVEKGAMNLQFLPDVIINEAQFPKPVHEKANPRPSCSHHLC